MRSFVRMSTDDVHAKEAWLKKQDVFLKSVDEPHFHAAKHANMFDMFADDKAAKEAWLMKRDNMPTMPVDRSDDVSANPYGRVWVCFEISEEIDKQD